MAETLMNLARKTWAVASGRIQAGRRQRRMELVETLNLGGKRQLMLIVCDGQRYLIGAGGDSVHSIEAIAKSNIHGTAGVCALRGDEAMSSDARRLH